ncbi:MAG TPA: alpha/beta hydrolase [Candidatus Limnocylindria bacterium]|nr:alpha/beta hydrolase [Candidatus Limnocylindria bacterium]
MPKKKEKKERNVADFIVPLEMNGLQGRMLRLPAPKNKNREILFIYGHHSTLERWWGVVQDLNQYGAVTMPDLPGFGGMQSLYKIGEKPDIDTLADYLAAFIKLRYKRRRISIAGLSFGFVVVTRMLQRYPDIARRVDLLVSVVGFAHREDFVFSRPRYWMYRTAVRFFSYRLPAIFFRHAMLRPALLRRLYHRSRNARHKFSAVKAQKQKDKFNQIMDFEIHLWHTNDARTHMFTSLEFLKVDNCQWRVDIPVHHVSVKADRYFNNHVVEQHMRVIFSDFIEFRSRMDGHAPSVIADMATAAPLFPKKLRTLLEKS